jgi:hypothetical protein
MLFAIASLTLAAAVSSPVAASASADASHPAADKASASANDVKADLVLASAIVDRKAQPAPEKLQAGQTLYAFTLISGPGGGYVEHVWTCNGKEVARHYLPVGQNKHWRTWSRHTLHVGQYSVRVLADNGAKLQETSFDVLPADKAASIAKD